MKQFLLYTFIIAFVVACGMSRRVAHDEGASRTSAYSASSYDAMQVSLRQAYRDWKGTPYRLGGRSASGVDCSSFVSIVFDEYFDVNLPTHTRRLLNEGQGVRRRSVKTGDLVFFKTGRKSFHVGIMIKEGEFLHASTSQGVTTSSIYDRYWSNRYLGARRVI